MNTQTLVQIENRLTAIEVTTRILAYADAQESRLIELHAPGILANIAAGLHSIRADLTEVIYANNHHDQEGI